MGQYRAEEEKKKRKSQAASANAIGSLEIEATFTIFPLCTARPCHSPTVRGT